MNNLRMHEIAHGKRELFRKIKEFHNWSILLFIDADVYIPWQHIKRHLGEVDENTYINFPYCPRTVQRVAKRQLGAFAIHRNCLTDRVVRCVYIAKIAKSGVLKTFYSDDCNLRNALIRAKRKGIIATDISSWHYGASLRRKPGGVMRYENGRVWHEAGDPQ